MNYAVYNFLLWICDWQVFKHYFEELEEESLRDNFVVVVRRYLCHSFCQVSILEFGDLMCFCVSFLVVRVA